MINQILGEDHWNELESILKEKAATYKISEDMFCYAGNPNDSEEQVKLNNYRIIMRLLYKLVDDKSGFRVIDSDTYYFSINEVVKIISEENGIDASGEEKTHLQWIRETFYFFLSSPRDNVLPSESFLKEIRGWSIHQLYLKAKEIESKT